MLARILGGLLLALTFGAPARAIITNVSATDLSPGELLVIDGLDFGVKGAKVMLIGESGAGKTTTLKVLSQIDTQITALFKKGNVGDHELRVRIKGGTEFVAQSLVSVRLPCVLDVQPANAQPGDTVTLFGNHFGDMKGKVWFNDRPAKVIDWERDVVEGLGEIKDRIRVVLSKNAKKTSNGPQDIRIRNVIGEASGKGDLVITGGGLDTYRALIDGKLFSADNKFDFPGYDPNGLGGTALMGFKGKPGSKKVRGLNVSVAGFDPTTFAGELPHTIHGDDVVFLYTRGVGPGADIWTSDFGFPFGYTGETPTLTITSIAGGVVSGFGEALGLIGISGAAQGTTLDVTGFEFSIPMIPE